MQKRQKFDILYDTLIYILSLACPILPQRICWDLLKVHKKQFTPDCSLQNGKLAPRGLTLEGTWWPNYKLLGLNYLIFLNWSYKLFSHYHLFHKFYRSFMVWKTLEIWTPKNRHLYQPVSDRKQNVFQTPVTLTLRLLQNHLNYLIKRIPMISDIEVIYR